MMDEEIKSSESVNFFLSRCKEAVSVLEELEESDKAHLLSINILGKNLKGSDIIANINALENEATELNKLKSIILPFIRIDNKLIAGGGLFSAGARSGAFVPEKYLNAVKSTLSNWASKGGTQASNFRCPNNHLLCNIANEFDGFRHAALALNQAQSAGKKILKGNVNPSLVKQITSNLRKVMLFHRTEFMNIVEFNESSKSNEFAKQGRKPGLPFAEAKRKIYMNDYQELKKLSDNWLLGAFEIEQNHPVRKWLNDVRALFLDYDPIMQKAAKIESHDGTIIPILSPCFSGKLPEVTAQNSKLIIDTLNKMILELKRQPL